MMFNGVRCILLSLPPAMVMVSLMFGISTKTLKVQSYTSTHLKIKPVKMVTNNRKKVKHSLLLNGQETEEELLSVIQKVL